MTHEPYQFQDFTMPTQLPQQASRYTTTTAATAAAQRPRSVKPEAVVQAPQNMVHPQNAHGTMPAPLAKPTQTPADPLEQRILDLLYPYRDECFDPEADVSADQERAALVLCGKLSHSLSFHLSLTSSQRISPS
tara:strand:- start:22679 stop:23080 length:402 start_codon:yes stop_codon:yes gene_type:complete